MDMYSIIAIFARLFLAFSLFKTGRLALKGYSRTFGNTIELASTVSLFLGFYVYLFTLILLVHLGIRMWTNRKRGVRLGSDPILFIVTFILFLNGPGSLSLDKLVGNI